VSTKPWPHLASCTLCKRPIAEHICPHEYKYAKTFALRMGTLALAALGGLVIIILAR